MKNKTPKQCTCGDMAKYHYFPYRKPKGVYCFKGMWICDSCKKMYFDDTTKVYRKEDNPVKIQEIKEIVEGVKFIKKCKELGMTNEEFNFMIKIQKKYNLRLIL